MGFEHSPVYILSFAYLVNGFYLVLLNIIYILGLKLETL